MTTCLARLQEQCREAQERFEEMETSAGDAWQESKEGVDRALNELHRACESAQEQV